VPAAHPHPEIPKVPSRALEALRYDRLGYKSAREFLQCQIKIRARLKEISRKIMKADENALFFITVAPFQTK